MKKSSISNQFKKIMIAGALTCLPIVVTFYLLLFIYGLFTSGLSPIIIKVGLYYGFEFPPYTPELSALLLIVLVIFVIGVITKKYLGNKVISLVERIIGGIPIVKSIYFGTKQVIDSFSVTSSGKAFSKVVLVEFPRRGAWVVAFVIKDSDDIVNKLLGDDHYNLFVPTAPNPTSGFPIMVAKSDTKDIDITVEAGIKFVISIGLLKLDSEKNIKKVIKSNVL